MRWFVLTAIALLAACEDAGDAAGAGDAPDADAPDLGAPDAGVDPCAMQPGAWLGMPGPPLLSYAVEEPVDPGYALPAVHALADLDRDCHLDLIATGYQTGEIAIFMGQGGGRFERLIRIEVGGQPRAVAVGDLGGDERLEIVVALPESKTVEVLSAGAYGRLADRRPWVIPIDGEPYAVAVGDLDGDRRQDIAVLIAEWATWGHESSYAAVIPLLHRTAFSPGAPLWSWGQRDGFGGRGGHANLRITDLDDDGLSELILSNPSPLTFVRRIRGPFEGVELAWGISEPVLGDFDGDGRTDIAIGDQTPSLNVLRNVGGGRFAPPIATRSDVMIETMTAADFDGDGDVDLAAGSVVWNNETPTPQVVRVFANRGDATFDRPSEDRTGAGEGFAASLLAGDLDRNGLVDLVAVRGVSMTALPLMNDGAFALPVRHLVPDPLFAVDAGDLDGDGMVDIAAVTYRRIRDQAFPALQVFRNRGGTFSAPVTYATSTDGGIGGLALGDLNGDGRLDAATALAEASQVAVLMNRGEGLLGAPLHLETSAGPTSLALADLDGDLRLDIVVGTEEGTDVLINEGASFAPRLTYGPGSYLAAHAVEVADFDGDGDPDVVRVDYASGLQIYENQGGGQLAEPVAYPTNGVAVTAGDLDRDGDVDLVISEVVGPTVFEPGRVRLFLNDGHGRFDNRTAYRVGQEAVAVAIADLNLDGRADILVANRTGNGTSPSIGVLLGRDHGFDDHIAFPVMDWFGDFAVADFDGDGRLDIAAAGGASLTMMHNRLR